jgi:hypothetical protein
MSGQYRVGELRQIATAIAPLAALIAEFGATRNTSSAVIGAKFRLWRQRNIPIFVRAV